MKCPRCGSEISNSVKFCRFCGEKIPKQSFTDRLTTLGQHVTNRIKNQANPIINNIKDYSTKRLDTWISKLRNEDDMRIGFFQLSEKNRMNLAESLEKIKASFGETTEPKYEEVWEDQQDKEEWQTNVEIRLSGENCIVCFKELTHGETIAVCPHCGYGGHLSHIQEWLKIKNSCPLCREQIDIGNLAIQKVR